MYLSFYRAAGGYVICGLAFLLLAGGQAALVACDWWLSEWTRQKEPDDTDFRIYLGLVLGTIFVSLFRAFSFFRLMLRGATNVHNDMFHGVIYASMRFFEANPVGRVLNRFSKDQSMADETLPLTYFDYSQCVCMVLGCLTVVGMGTPSLSSPSLFLSLLLPPLTLNNEPLMVGGVCSESVHSVGVASFCAAVSLGAHVLPQLFA